MPMFENAKAFLAPIAAEYPEARPCRAGIFFAPAGRIWKGLRIYRSIRAPQPLVPRPPQPDWLIPEWSAGMLAFPCEGDRSLSAELFQEPGSDVRWRTDYPDIVAHMCASYRQHALPILRAITTPNDIRRVGEELSALDVQGKLSPIRLRNRPFRSDRTSNLICLHVVNGDFDAALALFDTLKPPLDFNNKPYHDVGYERMVNDLLPVLRARDIPRIAQVLHGWEEKTARYLKIQKHWRPTPFDWE